MRRIFMNKSPASMLLRQHRERPCSHFALTRSRSSSIAVRAAESCLVLSNDDGVDSPALQSLAAKLRQETGKKVLVIAPARNKSAASMGLTLRNDMELRVRPDLGPDTYALAGTPTDCMMVALDATKGLLRALDLHPIIALSGPNYGPNMGTDVLLSGTVGAARTAGLYGVPSLASSSTSTDKCSTLDNAVGATLALTKAAMAALEGRPARNWPRDHVVVGGIGRRHVAATCEYESLPHNWVMDVEQVRYLSCFVCVFVCVCIMYSRTCLNPAAFLLSFTSVPRSSLTPRAILSLPPVPVRLLCREKASVYVPPWPPSQDPPSLMLPPPNSTQLHLTPPHSTPPHLAPQRKQTFRVTQPFPALQRP
ncbi:hypothetical protein Vafri_971 [Volvox africanus]|nr:hypothetical protein Vafri_971 [Volvox africanus]